MNFKVAFIGFGEAGSFFARVGGWASNAIAFDRMTTGCSLAAEAKRAAYRTAGVTAAETLANAAGGAQIVLSLVTADQALSVAREAAPALLDDALFCDGNSVAPDTKRAAAVAVEAAGARYVDMAILAPVVPRGLSVPILLSGPAAGRANVALAQLGFANIRVCGHEVGRASSIKMIRSVMIKGIEALTLECLLAASRAGVLEDVLGSLDAGNDFQPWRERADYNLDRMLVHGLRRAAEMREAAKTLIDLGQEPAMTRGSIAHQQAIGSLGIAVPPQCLEAKLAAIARAIKMQGVHAA